MAKSIYALLVGIDKYHPASVPAVPTLEGCVNDGDTLLAIFPAGSTIKQLRHLEAALGEARVTQVLPQSSKVEIISGGESLFENESYWAVVTSLPLPLLKIYL